MTSVGKGPGRPSICVVVQGLFERSDSIGFDAVAQVGLLRAAMPDAVVRLFAERFDAALHPGIEIEPIDRLLSGADGLGAAILIYHYCDGWARFDAYLPSHRGTVYVRWHNNTPPWFYIDASPRAVARTVAGFERIVRFVEALDCRFWVNSEFTARQLRALGCDAARIQVVYPASRYLFQSAAAPERGAPPGVGPLRLLFVGRVVAHKGHKQLIALADYIQTNTGRPVILECPGRRDESAERFNADLETLAARSVADIRWPGELGGPDLDALYANCHALVCLSEHEGFGLPVFEAMRCGLPVVAWARTALAELLVDHPLALGEFDLRLFAAAIARLDDPEFRAEVIERQIDILRGYDAARVGAQIEAGLGLRDPDAGAAGSPIRRGLSDDAARLRACEIEPPIAMAHDAGDNYVTLYDLGFYRRYVDNGAHALAGAATGGDGGEYPPFARIAPDAFATLGGRKTPTAIVFECDQPRPSHVVYGPYLKRPAGLYEAWLGFSFGPSRARSTVLRVDIYADSLGQVVARRRLVIPPSPVETRIERRFFFRLPVAVDDLEFRVQPRRSASRECRFTGLRLRRRMEPDGASARASAAVMATRLENWFNLEARALKAIGWMRRADKTP